MMSSFCSVSETQEQVEVGQQSITPPVAMQSVAMQPVGIQPVAMQPVVMQPSEEPIVPPALEPSSPLAVTLSQVQHPTTSVVSSPESVPRLQAVSPSSVPSVQGKYHGVLLYTFIFCVSVKYLMVAGGCFTSTQ